ncbi:MAG: hypothetical protein ACYC7D_14145 [Nitrososphaerales archaeon]
MKTGFLAWIVILAIGVILIILGEVGTFTTLRCGQTSTLVQNGTSYPLVPMCIASVGYDYLADAIGVLLVLFGTIKIFVSFPSRNNKHSKEGTA